MDKNSNIDFLLQTAGAKSTATKVYTAGKNGYYWNTEQGINVECRLENDRWTDTFGNTWSVNDACFEYEQAEFARDAVITYADNVRSGLHIDDDGKPCFGFAYEDFNIDNHSNNN